MSESKIVGVLGGLGPAATLDFYRKVVEATQATTDQDHLHLLIDSDPTVPDRNAAFTGTGPSPGPQLARNARRLEAAGAEFLVMVCNGAHAWADEIQAAIDIPFVHIVDVTVAATARAAPDARTVGVIATTTSLASRLYQRGFEAAGLRAVHPEGPELDRFMALMYRIKTGDTGPESRAEMKSIAQQLIDRGAEAVIGGCTEVPLVLGSQDLEVPLIASTDALVVETVRRASQPRR